MENNALSLPPVAGVATITEAGGLVTLKDPKTGIAIQFRKGETLQRYTHEIQSPARFLRSEIGLNELGIVAAELVEQAARLYPSEFEPLKC